MFYNFKCFSFWKACDGWRFCRFCNPSKQMSISYPRLSQMKDARVGSLLLRCSGRWLALFLREGGKRAASQLVLQRSKRIYIYLLVKVGPKRWKNIFLGIFFGQFPSRSERPLYTALLDIPKNRFDRFGPTFVFFKYLLYLNICEENRNAIKFICSGVLRLVNYSNDILILLFYFLIYLYFVLLRVTNLLLRWILVIYE